MIGIRVYRGTHQIGGSVTEITAENTRIIVDFGQELPDADGKVPGNPLDVPGVNRPLCDGIKPCDAVIFTHYHDDHIGCAGEIDADIPLYMGGLAREICMIHGSAKGAAYTEAIERAICFEAFVPFTIGDIRITAIPCDHSAFDAYMLLIEADGKKILHTGDFRLHGFRSSKTLRYIREFASDVDVLITEATTMYAPTNSARTSSDVFENFLEVMDNHKFVFLLCSPVNIDRIACLYNARPSGMKFMCDNIQKNILQAVADAAKSGVCQAIPEGSEFYQFDDIISVDNIQNFRDNLTDCPEGIAMVIRKNSMFADIMRACEAEGILIYSKWKAYIDIEPGLFEFIEPMSSAGRMTDIQNGGHADLAGLRAVAQIANPQYVIPIHTSRPDNAHYIGDNYEYILLEDTQRVVL